MTTLASINNAAEAAGLKLDRSTVEFVLAHVSAAATTKPKKRRVGFVGYGFLGKNLVGMVLDDPRAAECLELAFVVDLFNPASVLEDPR